jgi:hypothetical protein
LPHAPRFRTLYGHQKHLTADVIAVSENRQLGFIAVGVLFQTINALFYQAAESGADLESFTSMRSGVFDWHCELRGGGA